MTFFKSLFYTIAQRVEIVNIHYKNGEVFAMRKVRTAFGCRQPPSRTAVMKVIKKFYRFGQFTEVRVPTWTRKARTAENIIAVAESFCENKNGSILKRSKVLGLSASTLRKILYNGLQAEMKREDDYLVDKHNDQQDGKLHRGNECVFIGGAVPDFT